MHVRAKLMTSAATLLAATALTATAYAQDSKSLAEPSKDWETYHGSYKSWNYSPLKQINTENVSKLKVAFIEQVGRSTRGLETMPMAKDGILYYSGSYSKVFAVKGDTGEIIWSYVPKLDEETVARQTHSPYNRGMAMGDGKLYVGTVDGRLIALDMKTGQPVWDTKLINSQKLTVGFTGAPLLVKDKVIIGSQGGEWPYRGPIFGVNAKTGEKVWEFHHRCRHARGDEDLGQRVVAHRRWRRLDARHLRRRDQYGVVGHRQSRRRSMTGPARTGRPKVRVRATTSTRRRSSRSILTPASSRPIIRNCRTTPGTSTARSASSCRSTRMARSYTCIRTRAATSSSMTGLPRTATQDRERLQRRQGEQLRKRHRPEDG